MTELTSGGRVFAAVAAELERLRPRQEITLDVGPGPRRLAPHALSVNAEVARADTLVGDGRLVLLHDPTGPEGWQGTWRVVVFVAADLEAEMAEDPVMVDVGWTWVQECLGEYELTVAAFGGTVTRANSRSFGTLADRVESGRLEVRASWTPVLESRHTGREEEDAVGVIGLHVQAWLDLLSTMCGLAPVVDGVTRLGR